MNNVASHEVKYRPDIDGLRALAVLAVLFFHADIGCHGGFVGVDIFFVISGFLISSLLLKHLHAGTFSLTEFWERRIRRIVPAWAVVVVTTLVLGWGFYLPTDFAALGKSIIAQAGLVSNVFFWMQTKKGYFAASPDTMPLLHTWSLAVEEQFYILFPLLLLIPVYWKRMTLFELFVCLWMGSFVLCVFGSQIFPQFTFYYLPMRAWELLTGVLLANSYKNLPTNRLVREVCGCLGMGMIFYAIFFFDKDMRFPSATALVPCFGVALIILSSKEEYSLAGRIFMLRLPVFIGLISYSLYLWHWPLLVYARSLVTEELSILQKLGLLVFSFVLAVITWKYVETPVRARQIMKARWQIFTFAGGSLATFVILGVLANYRDGWSHRLSPRALSYLNVPNHIPFRNDIEAAVIMNDDLVELGSQSTNQPVFVLICGDSHAMAVTPIVDELCRKYSQRGEQATLSATPPVIGYTAGRGFSQTDLNPTFADAIIGHVVRNRVKNVVLVARWHTYSNYGAFKTNLELTIRQLLAAGTKVYLLKDIPTPGFDVPKKVALKVMRGESVDELSFSKAKHEASERDLHSIFDMCTQLGVTLLDPSKFFLDSRGRYQVVKNGELLYWDSNHLTPEGAKLLAPLFEPVFQTN